MRKMNPNNKVKLTSLNKQLADNIELLGETVWIESSFDQAQLLEGLVVKEARQLLVKLDHADEAIVVPRTSIWITQRTLDIAIAASNIY